MSAIESLIPKIPYYFIICMAGPFEPYSDEPEYIMEEHWFAQDYNEVGILASHIEGCGCVVCAIFANDKDGAERYLKELIRERDEIINSCRNK